MLLGTRVMVQCLRLVWVPMLVYISEELKMSTLATGSVMSSFSLGYLSTQIAGGIMADRYGGKPVQTMTMAIMVVAMMTAPHLADIAGASGLWVIYFHMGLFAGPQHPAYNAMVAACSRKMNWAKCHPYARQDLSLGTCSQLWSLPQ